MQIGSVSGNHEFYPAAVAKKKKRSSLTLVVVIITIALLLFSSVSLANNDNRTPTSSAGSSLNSSPAHSVLMVPVKYQYTQGGALPAGSYNGMLHVLVTFNLAHQDALNRFLAELSNPVSPLYHKYINRTEFASLYSPGSTFYNNAANYFVEHNLRVHRYSDRVSIQVSGSASGVAAIFNTTINTYGAGAQSYFAPSSSPELPSWLAGSVSSVSGLSNLSSRVVHINMNAALSRSNIPSSISNNGYPNPIYYNGNQLIWGSDMQVAYQENTLFNFTYPTKEVIATILWSGYDSTTASNVAPFYPADINAYYNKTIPAGQPHAVVYGAPVNGAPEPGLSAQNDTSGAVFENTLDLEMVGSTAPGSSIYNVYGPTASTTSTDAAFAYILNPNASFSALNNVSVISNSWGSGDSNDSAWYTYSQEAQARGITVLASSGDSGGNTASSKYLGGPDMVEAPSAMAYNSFGVTAVGGTTVVLKSDLTLASQIVWNISSSDTADGGPAGSTGGLSTVFSEPAWQKNSEANSVIGVYGSHRGVPDIAAIANNTLVFITVSGTSYYDNNNGFYWAWGTSIASPLVAGIIAEMNAVLKLYGDPNLGYLNPTLYKLGDLQYFNTHSPSQYSYYYSGSYSSNLPALPFSDVVTGKNDLYSAQTAWDLVTGWGSINAYNMTIFLINYNFTGYGAALGGVQDILNVSSLDVTSYTAGGSIYTQYNASIQQNFFVANSLGAPAYWIQNVIYLVGSNSAGWAVNYTAWSVYPFYGFYFSQAVFKYLFPSHPKITFPHVFDIKTWLSNLSTPTGQLMNFEVNSHVLQIPVPGAAYIIGSLNYNYYYNGTHILNGPFPSSPATGGLSPQFGFVGGPTANVAHFENPTSATLNSYVEPMGSTSFIPASSRAFGLNTTQTGEDALNQNWIQTGNNAWTMGIQNGSHEQGILSYVAGTNVTFEEQGLPAGTAWYVNLSNGESLRSNSTSVTVQLLQGTYSYTVSTADRSYRNTTGSGQFTVGASNLSILINFTSVKFNAGFTESGLPSGSLWYLNITGMQSMHTTNTSMYTQLVNGTYSYSVSTTDKVYRANVSAGTFTVSGSAFSLLIGFGEVTFKVQFSETGLPSRTTWYVNVTGTSNFTQDLSGTSATLYANFINGSYNYTIASMANSYYPQSKSGTFSISGSSSTISVPFEAVTYNVTLKETGFSTPDWAINISRNSQNWNYTSLSNATSLNLVNGTYSYVLYSMNSSFKPLNRTGTFRVNGSPLSIELRFEELYSATFSEKGLPSGTDWSLMVTSNSGFYEGLQGIGPYILEVPNGTYSFTARSGNNLYRPENATGQMIISASSFGHVFTFVPVTYTVSFQESGLSRGTLWKVDLTGSNTLSSDTSTISVKLENGSYNYTILNTSNYYVSGSVGGILSVHGSNDVIQISYVHYSYITGLITPKNATLTVNGKTVSTASGSFNLTVTNGTYRVKVSLKGYTPFYSNFTLNAGQVHKLNVTLNPVPEKTTSVPGLNNNMLFIAIGLIAIIVIAAVALAARRKR